MPRSVLLTATKHVPGNASTPAPYADVFGSGRHLPQHRAGDEPVKRQDDREHLVQKNEAQRFVARRRRAGLVPAIHALQTALSDHELNQGDVCLSQNPTFAAFRESHRIRRFSSTPVHDLDHSKKPRSRVEWVFARSQLSKSVRYQFLDFW